MTAIRQAETALTAMDCQNLDEVDPGEILLYEFLMPMRMSRRRLGADLAAPASRMREIVHGRRPIMADTALRLGLFFKMDPRFWMNLQTEYDLRIPSRELAGKVARCIRVYEPDTSTDVRSPLSTRTVAVAMSAHRAADGAA